MIKKSINIIYKLTEILTKQQKRLFWLLLLCAIVSAAFETLGVSVIIPLVNVMLTPEVLFEYEWMKPIIKIFSIKTNERMIIIVVTGTIILYLVKNMYGVFFSWLKAKYASKVQRECSCYMMKSYMNRGYTYFLDKNTNQILQGITSDVQGVFNIINCIIYSITKLLLVTMISAWMFVSDWQIACAMVLAGGFCLFIIMKCLKKPMREVGDRLREYTIDANQVVLQAVQGIKEVIVMRKQHEFVEQYEHHMKKRQREDIKRTVYTEIPNNIIEAFCVTAILVVLCIKVVFSTNIANFIAVLASFAVGAFRIMPAIGYLSSSFNSIIASLPALENVYENMTEAKKYKNQFTDIDVEDNPQYAMHKFQNNISLEQISFAYSGKLGNVIDNLSMQIEKNTSVAFVGESGAGKSTLSDILLGVLPIQKGKICIDGIDIREIPNLWGKMIGFVPQSIYLCDNSIAENVAFGVRKEDIDIDKVKNALKMANVYEFVETLPDTIWTTVGDRGVRISGGQRQRIGIARALYYEPQILVLDEATSALDTDTEKSVMEAIDSLQGDITMIIIAHRLTTVKNCDVIYEIKEGKAIKRKYEDIVKIQ